MTDLRFITVKKSDPEFRSYLMGTVKPDLRPVPTKSLNVGRSDELVTFEMKPISEVHRPSLLVQTVEILKIKSYILILFPLFFVLVKNIATEKFFDPLSLTFAVASLFFIYGGLNMRNDVADHISGFDRVNTSVKTKPINAGWITAAKLSWLSYIAIFIGVLLALPVLLLQFETWKIIAVSSPLLVAGQFLQKNSYKEKWFGELVLFFLMGIGVATGFQLAMGAGVDAQVIVFGLFWGSVVVFLMHVNNFSHLMTSTQAGIKNSITKLGFDKSKIFLAIWWSACLFLWTWYHFIFATGFWKWIGCLGLLGATVPFFMVLYQTRSPIGSDSVYFRVCAYRIFAFMVFLFYLELVWN